MSGQRASAEASECPHARAHSRGRDAGDCAPRPQQARHERRQRQRRRLARHAVPLFPQPRGAAAEPGRIREPRASSSRSARRCAAPRPGGAARRRACSTSPDTWASTPRSSASLETEPAFVLRYLREQFPGPARDHRCVPRAAAAETRPVRAGVATPEQLVDWLTRMMISAVLFPDPDPEAHGAQPDRRLPAAHRPEGTTRVPRRSRGARRDVTERNDG